MKKANFTNPLKWVALTLITMFSWSSMQAQCVLACGNNVQVSVNPAPGSGCSFAVTAEMILTNYTAALGTCAGGSNANFTVQILNAGNAILAQGAGSASLSGNQHIGRTYTVKVLAGSSACWGSISIEDKAAPVITCPTATVLECFQNTNPAWPAGHPQFSTRGAAPIPTALDNCTATTMIVIDEFFSGDICAGTRTLARTWVAVDAYGNQSAPCVQSIQLTRPGVTFPFDIMWTCTQYSAFNGITSAHALHPFIGDSNPATASLIEVNLSTTSDDQDQPGQDNAAINSTNVANGGTGSPGLGLDDQDVLELSGSTNWGSGVPNIVANGAGVACKYQATHADITLADCGTTFKIVRTWTVLDWCTNTLVTGPDQNGNDNVQVIKITDNQGPVVTGTFFTVSANVYAQHPQQCRSTGIVPAPVITDNCSATTTKVFIFNSNTCTNAFPGGAFASGPTIGQALPVAGGFRIPSPGIPVGCYFASYQVTDECGNFTEIFQAFRVVDDIAPVAICDRTTEVSLSSDGTATVYAETFDDGSYDNCCVDRFEVARMGGSFGPSVRFVCADEANNPIMVVFRVVDCYGNSNECMVEAYVRDKIAPTCAAPANRAIDCDTYFSTYEAISVTNHAAWDAAFGTAVFNDNCVTNVVRVVTKNIDNCGRGTITRRWTVTDNNPANRSSVCVQTITVGHVSNWVVEFPDDLDVVCTNQTTFDINDPSTSGEPIIFFETCELIGTTYEDRIFTNVPGACFKVERTWTVINWCIYDANLGNTVIESSETAIVTGRADINNDFSIFSYDAAQDLHPAGADAGDGVTAPNDDHTPEAGDIVPNDSRTFQDGLNVGNWSRTAALKGARPDGYITYKQVIKINDNTKPTLTCANIVVCENSTACGPVFANLEIPIADACSDMFQINYTIDAFNNGSIDFTGTGFASGSYPLGTHSITYVVKDRCGNVENCTFTFEIKDCKKPTPYCKNGLVIEIMQTGMVQTWASDFNAGSFDNCPGRLRFSFSSNVADTGRTYTCATLGVQPVEIWVTDLAGNQDFCTTFVDIQDNMNACGNGPAPRFAVSGNIATDANALVSDVNVQLNGTSTLSTTTDVNGNFTFANVPAAGDYTIAPMKDNNHLNGVTTFDLVLVSRHILGVASLDSPYKIIAADANRTNSVTTADLVALRRLILLVDNKLANNTSWRFVPKTFVFANAANPFTPGAGYTSAQPFPEVININNLSAAELNANFVAIKNGDVNNTAATNLLSLGDRTFNGNLNINTSDIAMEAGKTYTVDFTAADFNAIGYQFTMNVEGAEIVNILDGVATSENFGMTMVNEGVITASWNGDVKVAADEVLFSVVLRATETANLSQVLNINSRYTAAEAYANNGDLLNVNLTFNNSAASADYALYQNTPNPFNGVTTIGFNLVADAAATLTVTDVTGKVIATTNIDGVKGYNFTTINSSTIKGSGVFYYTLSTQDFTATKRMVIVE